MEADDAISPWMEEVHTRTLAEDTDRIGSARHIDSDAVLRGLQSAQHGDVFALGRVPPAGEGWDYTQKVEAHGRLLSAGDTLSVSCHGTRFTHIDGLNHFGVDTWYENPDCQATSALQKWSTGRLVSRAVIADIPSLRQCSWVGVDSPVTAEDISGALEQSGETFKPGDCLILYMGRDRFEAEGHVYPGTLDATSGRSGLDSSAARWLVENRVGIVCWDFMDARSADGKEAFSGHKMIWAAGLILIDNCHLGDAAVWSRKIRRRTGLFMVSPVAYEGITGQPVNPILIF